MLVVYAGAVLAAFARRYYEFDELRNGGLARIQFSPTQQQLIEKLAERRGKR